MTNKSTSWSEFPRHDSNRDDCASETRELLARQAAEAEVHAAAEERKADASKRRAEDARRHAELVRQRLADARAPLTERSVTKFLKTLARLTKLQVGWDDQGADPPSSLAAHTAMSVIATGMTVSVLPTRVDPSVIGGIALEYRGQDRRYCVFECDNDGGVVFVGSRGDGKPFADELDFRESTSAATWKQVLDFCEGRVEHVKPEQ